MSGFAQGSHWLPERLKKEFYPTKHFNAMTQTHTHTNAHLLDLITSVHYSDLFIFFITLLCLGFYSNLIHLIFSHINVLMTKWKHAPLFSCFLLQFLNVNSSLCIFFYSCLFLDLACGALWV